MTQSVRLAELRAFLILTPNPLPATLNTSSTSRTQSARLEITGNGTPDARAALPSFPAASESVRMGLARARRAGPDPRPRGQSTLEAEQEARAWSTRAP